MKKLNIQAVKKSVVFRLIVFSSLLLMQCKNVTENDNLSILKSASNHLFLN